MDNPWGNDDADYELPAPLPTFGRAATPPTPVERPQEDQGWSVPSWGTPATHDDAEETAWPSAADTDVGLPVHRSRTPSPAPRSPSPAREAAFASSPEFQHELEPSVNADDEFDDFGATRDEAEEEGWGGSSDWPAASLQTMPAVKDNAFPRPELSLPQPKLESPRWELGPPAAEQGFAEPAEEPATPVVREEEPEDAWAAQARHVAQHRPALPPKIPVELLTMIQDSCRDVVSKAFTVEEGSAFLPAAGMGLALASLLDSDGELAHLSSLKRVDLPLAAPTFAGSAVERLFRTAVDSTASRSAEIIKGSNARRGTRLNWSGGAGGGDIWSESGVSPTGPAAPKPGGAFDFQSALGTPVLPSERLDLDSLTGAPRVVSPPPDKGGLFGGLFGRRTPISTPTNMPATLLQPKRVGSPAAAPSSSASRSVSAASRVSEDSVMSQPRAASPAPAPVPLPSPVQPAAAVEASAAAATGPSAMSRFFGRFSKARASDELDRSAFPSSRYQDEQGSGYQDDEGFSYSNDRIAVSTSPTKAMVAPSQNLDDLFGVFDKPSVAASGAAKRSDPFDMLAPSPEIHTTPTVSASPSPFAHLTQSVPASAKSGPFGDLGGPSNGATTTATRSTQAMLPPKAAPMLSSFALAPPPSSIQPLNRSNGPSLLDMDEEAPIVSAPAAFSLPVQSSAPPIASTVKQAPAKVAGGGGALSSQDLSFFDAL